MNEIEAHLCRWAENQSKAALLAVGSPSYPDVAIVLLFYAGLHLTQAYLTSKGESFRTSDHVSRQKAIERAPELRRRFLRAYRDLKALSEDVRYDPFFVATAAEVTTASEHLHILESFLQPKLRTKGFTIP